jgi:nuclear pore complex protein Nup50
LAAGSKKAEYLGQIKALNLQVTSLINKHINTNALVDLSPVFQDYQKHINNIRTKYEVQPKSQSIGVSNESGGLEASQPTQGEEKGMETGEETFEHKEENSFFSTKCKLFLKKDGKYEERGKGFAHLKKCGDSDNKTQLVIRSDNALGSILLNIMVESARIEKVSDNNILLATVPNPPIPGEESGPATFLIRVKKELRDEMFSHLQKE